MLKKILLPSDGSEAALRAAREVATRFATRGETQVTVAVVILPLDTEHTDFDAEFVEKHNAHVRREAECALNKTTRILSQHDVPCTGKILEGNPVSAAIAKEAESGEYDIVAMSSRGMGIQQDKLHYMGSVTEHVIRRVRTPVLVFPLGEE